VVIRQSGCPGGQEAHEAHLRLNGECPWCGAVEASYNTSLDPLSPNFDFRRFLEG